MKNLSMCFISPVLFNIKQRVQSSQFCHGGYIFLQKTRRNVTSELLVQIFGLNLNLEPLPSSGAITESYVEEQTLENAVPAVG